MVPIKAPVVVGWVLMGFSIDEQLVADMQALAALQVTLLTRSSDADPWHVELSSLPGDAAAGLAAHRWSGGFTKAGTMTSVEVRGEEFGVHPSWLTSAVAAGGATHGGGVLALTSLSVDAATRIPHDLQVALLAVTVLSCRVVRHRQRLHRAAA